MTMRKTRKLTSVIFASVGRDARTGRYITVCEARKRPATTVVERVRVPQPWKRRRR
jgi:hypothetical protein